MRNAAAKEAEIDIFDIIGDPWYGTSAKDFVQELRGITADNIRLNINSPGGFVDDALAIYDAILNHPATVTAHITVAASAASFVAMAADKRVISQNGKIMIHDAQTFVGIFDIVNVEAVDGIIEALQQARDLLEEESQNIASIYAQRAGGDASTWRAAMQSNGPNGMTYRGQAAVDVGLADEVATPPAKDGNAQPMRVAAMANDDDPKEPDAPADDEDIDLSLIPPLANGYVAPLPTDFTRLVAANLPASTKGAP